MPLHLPRGQKIAVSVGVDFDAHSVWPGSFNMRTPGVLSRGEFGAEVGAPRLLKLFKRYDITTTWFTPTHTMQTFPAAFKAVMDHGHEIGAHGCLHEGVGRLEESAERALLERQMVVHQQIVGKRPRGYRSPSWDFSDNTLALLEEFKFDWDSSLMGRDFEPYRPRPVTLRDEGGSVFGAPGRLLEIPVSWALDDWPAFEFVPRANAGLSSNEVVFQRWKDHFDYAYREYDAGVLTIAVHPQSIGRAPNIMMLERFITYVKSHPGVWFAPLSDIADCWRE